MKKIFTMAAVALFMITSCTGDDDNNTNNSNSDVILVTKIVETDEFEDEYISNYFYDGTKVTKITHNDGSEQRFTYTGDKLTTIEHYEDGDLIQQDNFTYNADGQLVTFVMLDYDFDWGTKTEFTYNNNGTVSTAEYTGNTENQDLFNYNGTLTIVDNNIVSINSGGETITYTFDDKRDPFSNITSYMSVIYAYQEGGLNNVTSYNSFDESSTTTYTYNSSNFPTTAVENFGDGETYTTEFYYN